MDINYKFWLKEPKQENPTSIIFKFDKSGKRFIYGTGKMIYPALWNFDSQRPTRDSKVIKEFEKDTPGTKVQMEIISNRLENIIGETNKYFSHKEISNEQIDYKELRSHLKNTFSPKIHKKKEAVKNEDIHIDDVLMQFIRAIGKGEKVTKSGARYSASTLKTINNLRNLFVEFQDSLKRRIEITEISKELHEQFLSFMNEKKYSINTSGKHFSNFKVVIRDKIGDIIDTNYENEKAGKPPILLDKYIQRIERGLTFFVSTEIETTQVALTHDELIKLYHFDLSEKPLYELARDVFLCGCYTATRYSDYSRFGMNIIKEKLTAVTLK